MSMKRAVLLMLLIALFAPRLAWASHVSDHDPVSASSGVHTHHIDGHAHAHESDDSEMAESGAQALAPGEESNQSYAHQHPPSLLLSFAALLPEPATIAAPLPDVSPVRPFASAGVSLARVVLPHRPPRTA